MLLLYFQVSLKKFFFVSAYVKWVREQEKRRKESIQVSQCISTGFDLIRVSMNFYFPSIERMCRCWFLLFTFRQICSSKLFFCSFFLLSFFAGCHCCYNVNGWKRHLRRNLWNDSSWVSLSWLVHLKEQKRHWIYMCMHEQEHPCINQRTTDRPNEPTASIGERRATLMHTSHVCMCLFGWLSFFFSWFCSYSCFATHQHEQTHQCHRCSYVQNDLSPRWVYGSLEASDSTRNG